MEKYHTLITQLRGNRKKQEDIRRADKAKETVIFKLMEGEDELQRQIIKETKMLSVSPLELKLYDARMFLEGAEKDFEELSTLIRDGKCWSMSLEMGNEVLLNVSDGGIQVSFAHNPDAIVEFIKEHEIKVNIDSFLRAQKDLETKLKHIDSIVAVYGSLGEVRR